MPIINNYKKVQSSNKDPRISGIGLKVLAHFYQFPSCEWSGASLQRDVGVLSGTLYPMLIRFEEEGWLSSRKEEGNPSELGRPLKRFYTLTEKGRKRVYQLLNELSLIYGPVEENKIEAVSS